MTALTQDQVNFFKENKELQKMIKSFIIVSVITLSLTACQTNNRTIGIKLFPPTSSSKKGAHENTICS